MLKPAVIALATALMLTLTAGVGLGLAPAQANQHQEEIQQFRRRLGRLFRELDRNGDGRLDRDEVRANPFLNRHFERLDREGKGYLVPGDLRP